MSGTSAGTSRSSLAGTRSTTIPEPHDGIKVSRASADYVRSTWESIGTIVMGRNLFDQVNGWEGKPPAGDHVVVVSGRPKPEGWHPEASYHFVDGVVAAIDKARELAGERIVAVNAA